MQSAFIINDRTGKPYAVVGILAGGTEFYPIAESAVPWASWMTEDFAAKKITKQQLVVTLDNSMSVDGPMPANRANKPKLDELIKKAKKVPKGESDKEEMEQAEEKSLVPVISIMDARLDNLEDRDWRNTVNFKAKSFLTDSNKSTFAYEVKRTRAVWDDALSIPGTNRRGGWRCPPGTRYGGQITDRFGRNCGWGVARRLANEISDLGERLENVGDRRRERRVNRRNERVARRLREGGRVERAARAVGNALESATPGERQPGLLERAAGRVAEALDTPSAPRRPGRQRRGPDRRRPGVIERAAGRLAEALDSNGTEERRPAPRRPRPQAPQARPARPRQPRGARNNPAENRQRYVEQLEEDLKRRKREAKANRPDGVSDRDWNEYKRYVDSVQNIYGYGGNDNIFNIQSYNDWAKANGKKVPDAPAPAARPRQPRRPDNVSGTPVPAGAPRPNESLEQYKRRKYNEHQARVRKIRDEGGNAGFLRYDEWEQFHGPAVEDNWNRAQERNRGRGARRAATDAGAARSASRRPTPADAPEPAQPARRQRRPFNAPGQRGLSNEAAARRRRAAMERDGETGELKIVKHNNKYYVVKKSEVDRANANGANLDVVNEPPRPGRRPQPPAGAPSPVPPAPQGGTPGNDVVDPDLKPRRTGRKLGKSNLSEKAAIKALHEDGGKLEDVRDGIVVDAVIDDEIFADINGVRTPLDRQRLLSRGFVKGGNMRQGQKFENRRYEFELVKVSGGYGIWEVVKVKDKNTGEIWYMKTSQYGQNDGLLENIGMRAAQALEFGNDENHLRLNNLQNPADGKPIRWMMMRDVNQWDHGNMRVRRKFVDAARYNGARDRVEPRDAARLAVMDFVFANEDRHAGNFQVAEDANGVGRLAVIDNGLFMGGRVRQGENREATPAELRARGQALAGRGVDEYERAHNNGIRGLQGVYTHGDARRRAVFAAQGERAARRLREQLDDILSVERIEANGVKLSSVEKAHLEAVRIAAEGRLAYLLERGGLTALVAKF